MVRLEDLGPPAYIRVGVADLNVFEKQPFFDGRQLVKCLLALAQTQFLHFLLLLQ